MTFVVFIYSPSISQATFLESWTHESGSYAKVSSQCADEPAQTCSLDRAFVGGISQSMEVDAVRPLTPLI